MTLSGSCGVCAIRWVCPFFLWAGMAGSAHSSMRMWGDSRDELLGRPGPFDHQIKIVKRDELRATPRTGDVAIDDVIVRERIAVLLFDQAAGTSPLPESLGQLVFVHVRSPFLVVAHPVSNIRRPGIST